MNTFLQIYEILKGEIFYKEIIWTSEQYFIDALLITASIGGFEQFIPFVWANLLKLFLCWLILFGPSLADTLVE